MKLILKGKRINLRSPKLSDAPILKKYILEKSGFKFEGFERQLIFKLGRYHDRLRYGILTSNIKKSIRHISRSRYMRNKII